mmetsp:Transcript_20328/g.53352  ORF Transcript_20328/g.53352 Transcript_20328/m.53352 type:complete len:225 (-) Transcript_20328:439-1113(-)
MRRAPRNPSIPSAHSAMTSSSLHEFPKSSRLDKCESFSIWPMPARSPALRAAIALWTRSFSVTMCFALRLCASDSLSACSASRSELTSLRWVILLLPVSLLMALATAKQCCRSSLYFPSTSWCGALVFASTNCAPLKGANLKYSVRQSRNTTWPALPLPEVNWSRMPQPMPTKLFSAAFATWIISMSASFPTVDGNRLASSLAVAISTAAELDMPAPCGMSDVR